MVIHSTQHSTIGSYQPTPQPKPVHSHVICPSHVDKSHPSDSTSTTTNLNEPCSLDISCDHLLHLNSPSLSSEDTSSVESVEIEFVPDFEEPFNRKCSKTLSRLLVWLL